MARNSQILRAELAVVEAEEAFVELKTKAGRGDKAYQKAKADLREARRTFRELRGTTGVSPATVGAKANVV